MPIYDGTIYVESGSLKSAPEIEWSRKNCFIESKYFRREGRKTSEQTYSSGFRDSGRSVANHRQLGSAVRLPAQGGVGSEPPVPEGYWLHGGSHDATASAG